MALSVIGPSFGRTGTMSCKSALERLGQGPCYHMTEVYKRRHIGLWTDVIQGHPVPWAELFDGFRSVVDWPAAAFWKQIWADNPDARILLTRRDPDAWFDSMERTIFQALTFLSDDPELNAWRVQTRKLILEQTFGNRFDRAHCIAVLQEHERDVISSVPADRLLVFDVAQGWEPLCAFLGVPVPAEPFPRTNSTAEFRVSTGLDQEQ
ncbi:MAG TPA: sulfotransferase [Acidimicrobiia bacterium]|nr:sulfotransferase [Acidimicrobiia bacterium]